MLPRVELSEVGLAVQIGVVSVANHMGWKRRLEAGKRFRDAIEASAKVETPTPTWSASEGR